MNIIAHRGFWIDHSEKNTLKAFSRALNRGFGIETDFRDFNGQLVISHDIPTDSSILAEQLVDLYKENPVKTPLAINIKSDGLQTLVKKLIDDSNIRNYFVFDMSIPEMIKYLSFNIEVFTRVSEYEIAPIMIDKCSGIWIDTFGKNWFGKSNMKQLLELGKKIAVVSPELHQNEYHDVWNFIKKNGFHKNPSLYICTDYPEEAAEYFNVKN